MCQICWINAPKRIPLHAKRAMGTSKEKSTFGGEVFSSFRVYVNRLGKN